MRHHPSIPEKTSDLLDSPFCSNSVVLGPIAVMHVYVVAVIAVRVAGVAEGDELGGEADAGVGAAGENLPLVLASYIVRSREDVGRAEWMYVMGWEGWVGVEGGRRERTPSCLLVPRLYDLPNVWLGSPMTAIAATIFMSASHLSIISCFFNLQCTYYYQQTSHPNSACSSTSD